MAEKTRFQYNVLLRRTGKILEHRKLSYYKIIPFGRFSLSTLPKYKHQKLKLSKKYSGSQLRQNIIISLLEKLFLEDKHFPLDASFSRDIGKCSIPKKVFIKIVPFRDMIMEET